MILAEEEEDAAPIAKWITAKTQKGYMEYLVSASPVIAGGLLRKSFFERACGVILTSATIMVLGKFDNFLRRSGLSGFEQIECLDLPSPFNYLEQGTLIIPKMKASPKNAEAHTAEVTGWIKGEMESHGPEGMLVLFTSRRQMEAVFAGLPEALQARILKQGDQSKGDILKQHCKRVDANCQSVIFGLETFSEGVDLARKYNTKLILTKLPFAVPDTPVLRALSEWITQRGGNPFAQISVPDAARIMEQGVGRLIRSEDDYGTVVVLDTRLWTTNYGRAILKGLPPFRLMAMDKEVTLSA